VDHLTGLRVFSAVVRHRGFASAARALGLSRSSVSKHVDHLERRLGVRLIHRDPHRVACTEAGLGFHAEIASALAALDEAELRTAGTRSHPSGTLRLGAPADFAALHIAPHLDEFQQRHTELLLDIRRCECGQAFADDGLDMAIWVAASLPPAAIVARRLASARRLYCASPAYLARRGTPRHPRDLGRHAQIRYTGTATTSCSEDLAGVTAPLAPDAALRTDSLEVARSAALSGVGIAQLPAFAICADLQAGRLVSLLDAWPRPSIGIFAVYPDRRYLPAGARVLIEFLSGKLAEYGDWRDCCRTTRAGESADPIPPDGEAPGSLAIAGPSNARAACSPR
jgi:DNA-binding transcriptional LysR family regulator